MRIVIQRVSKASVTIANNSPSKIKLGYVLLIGFEGTDTIDDIEWMANKIINLRLFADENGLMNLSIKEVEGELLCISQFTLYAKTKKGNRPSFINAAKPDIAIPLYNKTIECFKKNLPDKVKTGTFGADMTVEIINDGPVTIIIDSKNKT